MFHHTNYCDAVPKPEGCGSFYLTAEASYIPTISGSISAASSFFILIIATKTIILHGSVYHRIMASMAIFDLVASVALAFTTTAMPKDVVYPFEGRRVYGTVGTCEAQAFGFVFGGVGSFFMIIGLSIFYASLIQFRMSDTNLRYVLEPIIHFVAWAGATSASVTFLSLDAFNPGIFDPWCTITRYPYNCKNDEECIRGGILTRKNAKILNTTIVWLAICGMLIITLCMCLIIFGSWMNNEYFFPKTETTKETTTAPPAPPAPAPPREVMEGANVLQEEEQGLPPLVHHDGSQKSFQLSRSPDGDSFENNDILATEPEKASFSTSSPRKQSIRGNEEKPSQSNNSTLGSSRIPGSSSSWPAMRKILVQQAFMYVGAFALTWCFAILGLFIRRRMIDRLYLIMYPLQGFFNAAIFIYHKVHNMRSANPSIRLCDVIGRLFFHQTASGGCTNSVQFANLPAPPTTTAPPQLSRLEENRDGSMGINNGVQDYVPPISVDEASKDVHNDMSSTRDDIPEEVSFIFDKFFFSKKSSTASIPLSEGLENTQERNDHQSTIVSNKSDGSNFNHNHDDERKEIGSSNNYSKDMLEENLSLSESGMNSDGLSYFSKLPLHGEIDKLFFASERNVNGD